MTEPVTSCWCGEKRHKVLFAAGSLLVVMCAACGQSYTVGVDQDAAEASYDDRDFFVGQNKYLDPAELVYFTSFVRKISAVKGGGRLLDVGCSVGTLLDAAKASGFAVAGVEISKWASEFARSKGHHVITGALSDASFADGSFDVVVLNHVVEHVPDPLEVMEEVFRILKYDGVAVVGVPNFGSLMARTFKEKWTSLHPDQHLWHFDHATLLRLLTAAGFEEIAFQSMENHPVRGMRPVKILMRIINVIGRCSGSCEAMLLFARKKPS